MNYLLKLMVLQLVFQVTNLMGVSIAPISVEHYSLDCFLYSQQNKELFCSTTS